MVPLAALDVASPAVLWGLVAAGVPVVLHLLFRQKPVVVRFPAIRFLLASRRETTRRFRLRQLLLLAVRVALIAGFVTALAGPRWVERPAGARQGRRRVNGVVVLDRSYSMSHVGPDGSPRFHRAQALALQLLELLSADSRLAVLLHADQPQGGVRAFTFDRQAVTEAIQRGRCSFHPTDCTAALLEAHRLFRSEDIAEARAIFLFTDLTANGWPPLPAPADPTMRSTPLYVVDVGDETSENRSVTLARQDPGAAVVGLPFSVEARVSLPPDAGSATVELLVEEQVRGERVVRAQGPTACTFQLTPERPGVLAGVVALRGSDPIAADDRACFAVPCGGRRRVLVVDGAGAEATRPTAAFFLTRALAPRVPGQPPPMECRLVVPPGLAPETVADCDAVFLVDVPSLATEQWRALARHVAEGGALLVFAGPRVDAASYNAHARDALDPHGPLLPCTFGPVRRDPEGFRFRLGRFDHPLLRPFETENPHLGEPAFTACLEATPGGGDASPVVLRFTHGLPALLEGRHGHGRVLVFTSGAGLAWGNFPRVPHAYVPFLHEALRYATDPRQWRPWVHVGEAIQVAAPAGERLQAVRVQPPDEGRWSPVALPRDAQGRFPTSVALPDTEQPGIYLIEVRTATSTTTRLAAVNVQTRESAPERLSPDELAALLPAVPLHVCRRLEELREPLEVGGRTTDLNRLLLPLLLALVVAEVLLANRFYGRAPADAEGPVEERVTAPPPQGQASELSKSGADRL